MQRAISYREQSRVFLAQAYEELAKGDLPQASEKGWGAAAQMVKAIAAERKWNHFRHRDLYRVVDKLYRETTDSELGNLFGNAGYLHVNFYENTYSAVFIERRLQQVGRFVDRVEGLLGATPQA